MKCRNAPTRSIRAGHPCNAGIALCYAMLWKREASRSISSSGGTSITRTGNNIRFLISPSSSYRIPAKLPRDREHADWSFMNIEAIVLREIRMRLKAPFETSFGVTQDRRILLVEVVVDGVSGWGEVTTTESPSYNSETTDTAWHIISEFIVPRLIGRDLHQAVDVAPLLSAIRGHQMAKAGVENAIWHAEAKLKSVP